MNEADFDLLTLNIASLHPQVAEELRAAKELYKLNNNNLPGLLNTDQYPPTAISPKTDKAVRRLTFHTISYIQRKVQYAR